MGVRIKLKVKSLKSEALVDVNSLLNTGFESEDPEIILPLRVAELLGFYPALPEGAVIKTYETTGGLVRMYHVKEGVEIQAITEDRPSNPVRCAAVLSELEKEVLLSDKTIEDLEMVLERPREGLWRFRGEEKVRKSVEPQYW